MTTTAMKKAPSTARVGGATDLAELVHYTPEQVQEAGWLPFSARTLRDRAGDRTFPHSKAGGRISFTLRHIREIQAMYEVRPIRELKRSA